MTSLIARPEAISKNHQFVFFFKLKKYSFKNNYLIKAFLICVFRIVISIVVILTFSETTMELKEEPNPEEILDSNISSCGFRYNN